MSFSRRQDLMCLVETAGESVPQWRTSPKRWEEGIEEAEPGPTAPPAMALAASLPEEAAGSVIDLCLQVTLEKTELNYDLLQSHLFSGFSDA